jgi:hypothetical protein
VTAISKSPSSHLPSGLEELAEGLRRLQDFLLAGNRFEPNLSLSLGTGRFQMTAGQHMHDKKFTKINKNDNENYL